MTRGDWQPPPGALDRLAARVSRGEPILQDDVSECVPLEAGLAENLRAIGAIMAAFRSVEALAEVGEPASLEVPGGGDPPVAILPAPPIANFPSPPFRWGSFDVMEILGDGATGRTFRAVDPVSGQEVALKLIPADPGSVANRPHPARVEGFTHPNVLTIRGTAQDSGFTGVWSDLVHGMTLETRLTAHGPLELDEVAWVGIDLARALGAVHAEGLVHGDVKAANVIRDASGTSILLDFGAARDLRFDPPTDEISGTPASLAPEVLRGVTPSPQADLYSLGALLYRLATGAHIPRTIPFDELTQTPRLPQPFASILVRALAPIDDRFASASELESELQDFLLGRKTSTLTIEDAGATPELLRASTRFIGRELELDRIQDSVRRHRHVTLTGPPGIGKTRLALEAARRFRAEFPEVCFVELAALESADEILAEVARTIGLHQAGRISIEELVERYFHGRRALVVLDNCEHLLPQAGETLDRLGRAARELHLLVTSREQLGIAAELGITVPPLELPEEGGRQEVDSVRLFYERSGRRPGGDAGAVEEICRAVEGHPFAIELAASRARSSPVALVASDLRALLTGPAGGERDAPRGLHRLVSSSYARLGAAEARLFERLSVFAGSWSLAAAAEICAGGEVSPADVLPLLTQLTAKSLVARDARGRYRMLEVVRAFSREAAVAGGGADRLEERHRSFYSRLARDSVPALQGPEETRTLQRLEAERANLRAAIDSFLRPGGDVTEAMRLFAALGPLWALHGHWEEGLALARAALAQDAGTADRAARASLVLVAPDLATRRGEAEEARAWAEEALTLHTELRDARGVVHSLLRVGMSERMRGELTRAHDRYTQAVATAREIDSPECLAAALSRLGSNLLSMARRDEARAALVEGWELHRRSGRPSSIAGATYELGLLHLDCNEWEESERWFEEALVLYRDTENPGNVANTLLCLGRVAWHRGNGDLALRRFWEARTLYRRLGDVSNEIRAVAGLGDLELRLGRGESARRWIHEAIRRAGFIGDRLVVALSVWTLGKLEATTGATVPAIRLLAGASAAAEQLGRSMEAYHTEAEPIFSRLRAAASPAEYDRIWQDGFATPIELLVEEVLARATDAPPDPHARPSLSDSSS